MTGKQRILCALQRREPDCVPTFEWFIDAGVGQALTGSADPFDIVDRLDIDGINIRADYTKQSTGADTFVDEWGAHKQLTGDAMPAIIRNPITSIENHRAYQFPAPDAPHRFKSLERALQRFGDRRAIILNLRDGFSDLRDLIGYEEALMVLVTEPVLAGEILDRSVEHNLKLAELARRRYGTSIVATTDDIATATGLLMHPDTYSEVIAPRFKAVMRGYKDLGYLIIKHCDGQVLPVADFWIECGIDCLDPIDPGAGLTMADMKRRFGGRICLKGNVDCTGALCDGTEQQVEEETRQCILAGGQGGGLILSTSNTVHRGVKPANYAAMLRAMRKYGKYGGEGSGLGVQGSVPET